MSLDTAKRVLIIGLDGATWDLLDGWAKQGHLPTIERLRSRGTWGSLRTTMPPATPPSWTSMYTGTNPGKHGIFGWFQRQPNGYRLSPISASARRTKTIFRILSDAGLKVGVLNAPATYPPEPVNGMLVPGIPLPEGRSDYTYPPELGPELHSLTGGKHRHPPGLEQAAADVEHFMEACHEYARAVTSAATFMMDRLEDWDLFFVQFQVTDAVQHQFWHGLDPDHPKYDPKAPESIRNAILDVYKTVDQCLVPILERAGEEADVLVVSDHGGGPLHEQIYLNIWLWQQGWLKFKRGPTTMLRRLLYTLGITPEFLRRHIYSRLPHTARKSVEARKSRMFTLADRFFLSLDDVDWERTRAYAYGTPLGSVYVNLRGREPQGCVSPDEYEDVLDEIGRKLKQMRHPVTGQPLVDKVIRSSETYHGPFAKDAPDLQLLTRGLKYQNIGALQFQSKRWIGQAWHSGHHTLDGIFLASGPHLRRAEITGASILDIAPTVLTLLGQPIPDWMDGNVLTDSIEEGFLKAGGPELVHEEETVVSQATSYSGYTAEDEAQITKRLADLGYIE